MTMLPRRGVAGAGVVHGTDCSLDLLLPVEAQEPIASSGGRRAGRFVVSPGGSNFNFNQRAVGVARLGGGQTDLLSYCVVFFM